MLAVMPPAASSMRARPKSQILRSQFLFTSRFPGWPRAPAAPGPRAAGGEGGAARCGADRRACGSKEWLQRHQPLGSRHVRGRPGRLSLGETSRCRRAWRRRGARRRGVGCSSRAGGRPGRAGGAAGAQGGDCSARSAARCREAWDTPAQAACAEVWPRTARRRPCREVPCETAPQSKLTIQSARQCTENFRPAGWKSSAIERRASCRTLRSSCWWTASQAHKQTRNTTQLTAEGCTGH